MSAILSRSTRERPLWKLIKIEIKIINNSKMCSRSKWCDQERAILRIDKKQNSAIIWQLVRAASSWKRWEQLLLNLCAQRNSTKQLLGIFSANYFFISSLNNEHLISFFYVTDSPFYNSICANWSACSPKKSSCDRRARVRTNWSVCVKAALCFKFC